jgi:hypothetical protein
LAVVVRLYSILLDRFKFLVIIKAITYELQETPYRDAHKKVQASKQMIMYLKNRSTDEFVVIHESI